MTERRPAPRKSNVSEFPISAGQAERLSTQLEIANNHAEQLVVHLGQLADNSGRIAGTAEAMKNFVVKWVPWIIAAGAVFVPKLQAFIATVPFPHT